MAVPSALRARIVAPAYRISAVLGGVAVLLALMGFPLIAGIALALALANLGFFRNPRRTPPAGEHRIVSPADGRVVEVSKWDDPQGFVGPAWKVAIFLSVFDVHVNRNPISGTVRAVRRRGGRYLAAFRSAASELNVCSRMDIEGRGGLRLAVVQISGLIARRIVSYPDAGDLLERGEPYGLICYGSRVEVYVPVTCIVTVKPGDRVNGGTSVIAESPDE